LDLVNLCGLEMMVRDKVELSSARAESAVTRCAVAWTTWRGRLDQCSEGGGISLELVAR
jgi:hypothetical protein